MHLPAALGSTLASTRIELIGLVPWDRYEDGGRTDPLAPKASSTLATKGSGVDGAVTGTAA